MPRWWRDFEITYRRKGAVYLIKVENPSGVSRGVVSLEVDGVVQNVIELIDDDKTHNVRIVMGEQVKTEETSEPAQQAQA